MLYLATWEERSAVPLELLLVLPLGQPAPLVVPKQVRWSAQWLARQALPLAACPVPYLVGY
ncbi:hypothetical protein HSBAA_48590 [Vreelandella sulfidaeris]|uniref:Uncharacterized protein n=1 Tax=Vreelandella sulfidaeris TaxID=115553 RepID=A0A455UE24_9GAMM|nr:hypothetical protein HSBAA_48590 [Halomonas sulfidaeris]